jgi:hypothetical protein
LVTADKSPTHKMKTRISEDTQWAVAAAVPTKALDDLRRHLFRELREAGLRTVVEEKGFAALLVFGGSSDQSESLAQEISDKYATAAYALDFDDEAPSVRKFEKQRIRYLREEPWEFLEQRGIIAPGFEPLEDVPTIAVGVIDDVTVEEARHELLKVSDFPVVANSRGVVIDAFGRAAMRVGRALKRRTFSLHYEPGGDLSCTRYEPGKPTAIFGAASAHYVSIDSIEGETTFEGIVRVLDIPASMLVPK